MTSMSDTTWFHIAPLVRHERRGRAKGAAKGEACVGRNIDLDHLLPRGVSSSGSLGHGLGGRGRLLRGNHCPEGASVSAYQCAGHKSPADGVYCGMDALEEGEGGGG
jgi:hypothetical protein